MTEVLPRRFGGHVLTAQLGEDALGRVYRAMRESKERTFVRLRILEGPEISEDAVLDAIQENGEIHAFLKNPAIARGVQMDSAGGIPFLAWNEENGRTLDQVIVKARETLDEVPIEHALLIAEKIAAALEHAYNTSVDGDRTLHGLVWPGFVSLSDDGEIRVTGFGLAAGFLPSLGRPHFTREIGPYLAPEERREGKIGPNSDVYSVGAILFELLTGRRPGETADASSVPRDPPPPPEVTAVLRMALSDSPARYQSSGELRRELGKLLFSGPYAPSTFNFAYYLNSVFRTEIEEETRARLAEVGWSAEAAREADAGGVVRSPAPPPIPTPPPSRPSPPPVSKAGAPPLSRPAPQPPGAHRSRAPLAVGGALVAAAVALALFVIARQPSAGRTPTGAANRPTALTLPTPMPEPPVSTAAMSETQFQNEVSRRLEEELRKVQEDLKAQQMRPTLLPTAHPQDGPPVASVELAPDALVEIPPSAAELAPTESFLPEPTAVAVAPDPPPVTARPAPVEASTAAPEEPETAPSIKSVVKPPYPPLALQSRIRGIVLLRVLVSESGLPIEVEVLRGVRGLTDAAVLAVRRWTFHPARRNQIPVRAWTTIPIPFEP